MPKLNCWEFRKCGRQPGGHRADDLGVCPASIESRTDGMNSGIMGGRVCWAIAGTFCNDAVQRDFKSKMANCVDCEFYRFVVFEEGSNFQGAKVILKRLQCLTKRG